MIASQLHYIFSIDPSFAQAELLPLFDWTQNETAAEQCWHGFLVWGRWLPGFTETTASELSSNDCPRRLPKVTTLDAQPSCTSQSWPCTGFQIHFPTVGCPLLSVTLDEQSCSLASEIDHALNHAGGRTVEEIWATWLKRYWEERILGRPKPFGLDEAKHTGCWALSTGKYVPEAVKLVAAIQPTPALSTLDFLVESIQRN